MRNGVDEMTATYTYDARIVSDLHKDAYGFRPSQGWWQSWNVMTEDQKQAEWNTLLSAMESELQMERERDTRNAEAFESRIEATIAVGASDRVTAIRWIIQGLDLGQFSDRVDDILWELSLPTSYAEEIRNVVKG